MRTQLFIAFIALVFSACGLTGSNQAGGNTAAVPGKAADSSNKDEIKENAGGAQAENKTPEFQKLSFEAKNLPKDFAYEGRISGGAKWTDANGENTLIVSEKTEKKADLSHQRIFGYLYAVKDGQTKLLWKIQDFADNYCDAGKGLTSPIDVRDLDEDGVAENMFVYNIAGGCDVSPVPYKLMMHSGEKKLAVRGANAVQISGYDQKSEKNFDGAFNGAPKVFRDAASAFWDRHVAPLRAE